MDLWKAPPPESRPSEEGPVMGGSGLSRKLYDLTCGPRKSSKEVGQTDDRESHRQQRSKVVQIKGRGKNELV